jgi:hypothetical protein
MSRILSTFAVKKVAWEFVQRSLILL